MLYERDYHLGLTETEEQQYEEITVSFRINQG